MLEEAEDELEEAELDADASGAGLDGSVVDSEDGTPGLGAESVVLDEVVDIVLAALVEDTAADDGTLPPLPGVTRNPYSMELTPLLEIVPL